MSQVVLFYSNHCQHSKTFLLQLQEANVDLNKVCVDSTPRDRIPSIVRSVPALIIAGHAEPVVGDQAFSWLKSQKQSAQPQRADGGQPGQQPPPDGPAAWHMEEMGSSFSDQYSFLDSHTGSSIPKNFSFLDSDAAQGASQPAQGAPRNGGNIYGNGGGGGPGGIPGGAPMGRVPPSFQSPPEMQQRASDELAQRMETMQQHRDDDIPRNNNPGGGGRFEDLPMQSR
jgi:hypothetical protein